MSRWLPQSIPAMRLRLPYSDVKALAPPPPASPPALIEGRGQGITRPFGGGHLAKFLEGYGGTQAIDWAFICARLIAESASNAEYNFQNKAGVKLAARFGAPNADNPDRVAPPDLVQLMAHPTPWVNYDELMELLLIDLLFTGDHFLLKHNTTSDGKPAAMFRLRPDLVDVIPGETRLIAGYRFHPPGSQSQPVEIPADLVIHFKLPNPHNPFRGMGVIAAASRAMDIELALTDTQATFFEQGTHLGGVLSTDRRVPDPVFQKIKRQFNAMYSGRTNAGKVAVLENGLKFQATQSTPADAMYAELTRLSRDRIAHAFRVPLPLVGNMENANYKMAEAQRIFDTKTMRPLLNKVQDKFSAELTQAWDLDFVIDYQYVMPDEDRLKLAESVAALPGIKVREVRKQAGLPLLGDERDEIVLNLPLPDAPSRNLSEQGGRPPNGENVPTFPGPGDGTPSETRDANGTPPYDFNEPRTGSVVPSNPPPRNAKAAPTAHLLTIVQAERPEAERAALVAGADRALAARTSAVDRGRDALLPTLVEFADELAAELRGTLAHAPTQSKAARQDPETGLVARLMARIDQALGRRTQTVRDAMVRLAENQIERAIEHHTIMGIPAPELTPEQLRAAALTLADRDTGIKSITGTLRERVLREVREGVRRGYTPDQIVEGVPGESFTGMNGVFTDWSNGQAKTIALTESTVYYNEGVLAMADAAGTPQVLVLDGEDYDQPCRDANGSIWDVAHARAHSIEHPNCRRSFLPVVSTPAVPSS